MSLINTEFNNLVRDTSSKAILITDDIAREEFRKRAMKQKNQLEHFKRDLEYLKNSVDDINNLKQEINEIKQMLLCLCKNKEQ